MTGETATEGGVELLEEGIIAIVDRVPGARLSGLLVGKRITGTKRSSDVIVSSFC